MVVHLYLPESALSYLPYGRYLTFCKIVELDASTV